MEGEIPGIMAMLRCASNCDRNALEELGLEEGFEYNIPVRFDPEATSSQELEEEIDDLMFFAEAANRLHMDKPENVARKAISHMIHSFYCLYDRMPKIGGRYSGEDLSTEIIEFAKSLFKSVDILRHLEKSKDEARPPSERHKKQESDEDSDQTSVYVPADESESSTDDDSDDDTANKKPRASSSLPTSKRPKHTASPVSSPSGSPSTHKTTRSHHKRKACPLSNCSFNGNDLRRHLLVHVKKGDLAEEAVDKLLSIVRAGAAKRGKRQARKGKQPVKGRQRKWCPVPGCNQLVLDMARHLQNPSMHELERSSKAHIRYLKMATPYTGFRTT